MNWTLNCANAVLDLLTWIILTQTLSETSYYIKQKHNIRLSAPWSQVISKKSFWQLLCPQWSGRVWSCLNYITGPLNVFESEWWLRATPACPLFLSHGLSHTAWRATIGRVQEVTESLTAIWCFSFWKAVRCISDRIKWPITRLFFKKYIFRERD